MLSLIGEISEWAIPGFLVLVLIAGVIRRVPVFETFVEGAEQGFEVAIKIIPFLVAMIVAISIFRASGAMEITAQFLAPFFSLIGAPPDILPHAIMRPLSGGAALGIATEVIKEQGPDSLVGYMISTMQGSTDTTFFVLTLYFGSVGITRYRYAIWSGLLADLTTLVGSIYIVNRMFG